MCCGKKKNNKVHPEYEREASGALLSKSLLLCVFCAVF